MEPTPVLRIGASAVKTWVTGFAAQAVCINGGLARDSRIFAPDFNNPTYPPLTVTAVPSIDPPPPPPPTAVPAPAGLGLFVLGLAALGLLRRSPRVG
ncbi:hypothetical protein [Elioraea sp.]|uniref:hypothetical protein n=1 Tax=Elioraea sp. TaxID=2185103 RepID=UPI0025BE541E|nr:hypothetical protein [Elioraea sp.]